MTQFNSKYAHMHRTGICEEYEENHAFSTFTISATHFLWNTTQTSPCSAKAIFYKNLIALFFCATKVARTWKQRISKLTKQGQNPVELLFIWLMDRNIPGYRIATNLSVNRHPHNQTLLPPFTLSPHRTVNTSLIHISATDGSFCMRRRVNYLNFPESIEWPEVPTHTPCREPLEGGGVKRARSTSTLSDSGKGSGVRKVQTFTDLIEPRIVNEGLVQRAPVLGPEARLPAPLPNKNKPPVSGHKKTSSVGAIAPGIVTSNERRARKEASPASRSASNPSSTARPVNVSGTNEHPSSPGTKCKVATRRRQLPPCPRKGSQVAGDEDGEGQTSESFQRLKLMRIPSVEMNHNAFDEYFSDDCPLHRSDDVDLTTRSASGHVTGHASWASAGNLTDLANVSRVEHPPVVAKSPPPLPSVGPNNVSKPSQPPLPTRGPVGAVSFNARNDQVAFHPTGLDKHCQNTTSLSETEKSPSPQPVPARVPAASVKESPDDNLEELPLPLLKPAPSNTWAKGEGFASLMAEYVCCVTNGWVRLLRH